VNAPPVLRAALDAGATVLAPGRELADALFDAVERDHRAAGREVWPTPRVRDFASWLREGHERRFLSGAETARCLDEIETRELWRRAVAESRDEGELLDPGGAARAARRAHRTMIDHGIPRGALDAAEDEESRRLSRWIARFLGECRDLGAVASDELLERTPAPAEPLAWIDSPAWRPAARRWLARHAGEPLGPPAVERSTVFRCDAPSPDAELASAAAWLGGQVARRPALRAWMLIEDLDARRAQVEDAFDAAFAPWRFDLAERGAVAPYAIAGGTPLAAYPRVAAALDWLDAAASPLLRFERFSALLLRIADSASVAARLDVELRRVAPFEAPLSTWLTVAEQVAARAGLDASAALRGFAAARAAVAAPAGPVPISRWVASWMRAFEQGLWHDRAGWSSTEFQSIERFRELLARLAVAEPVFGRLTAGAAARALARAARDERFQPQTGIPAIWVSGTVGDPWLRYDVLWIAGFTREAWPAPVDPVPLLPVALQRRFGVEAASAAARAAAAGDLLARWERRAAMRVFSIAAGDGGVPVAPSALVPGGARLEADAPTRPLWRAQVASAPPLERVADERGPALEPEERTAGVATLRAQSRCPFRGFAEGRLRGEALRLPVPGFDPAERGTLVHAALERIWRSLGGSAALAAQPAPARRELIAAAVDAALERAAARRDPGPRWRERERVRTEALLARWLTLEAERTPFLVERLEEAHRIARHGGLEFACRLDRVDRLADGTRVLIDYKTNVATPDWRGERPDNPQLPLYAGLAGDALGAVAYAQVNASECRFVAEAGRDGLLSPAQKRTALEGESDFAALRARCDERLERLATAFARGDAGIDPAPGACARCALPSLCRIADRDAGDDDEPR
jgi:probable DNA repair protein